MKQQIEECKANGMDDVLPKPIDREQLSAILDRYAPPASMLTGRHVVKPAPPKKVEKPSEVSMERFREVTGGDAELAHGLTASFVQSVTQVLTDIEGGLAREDLIGVRFVPLLPGQAREL